MLGWHPRRGIDGVKRDFYVRQLWDGKGSALVELMEPRRMGLYAELCGADARPRARAIRRPDRDRELPRPGDTFDRAMARFAETYADQNERDYKTLTKAVEDGQITAQTGI